MVNRRLTCIGVVKRLGDRRQVVSFTLAGAISMLFKARLINVLVMVQSTATGRGHFRVRHFTGFFTVFMRTPDWSWPTVFKVSGSLSTVWSVPLKEVNVRDLLPHSLNVNVVIFRFVVFCGSERYATSCLFISRDGGLSFKRGFG